MTPQYETCDPKGWCGDPRRGAALGRRTNIRVSDPQIFNGKVTLQRIRLNGDYDRLGTYWGGGGAPLYWFAWEGEDDQRIDAVIRAESRADAKAQIRKQLPRARFYR